MGLTRPQVLAGVETWFRRRDEKEARKAFEPFGQLRHELYEQVVARLEASSDEQLRELVRLGPSLHNGWWASVAIRDEVVLEAERILRNREAAHA